MDCGLLARDDVNARLVEGVEVDAAVDKVA